MRLIDAEALKAKWYKINDIDENDRGARFVGYTEIARLIDQAPTVSADAVHGEWVEKEVMVDEDTNITEWQSARCSVCGKYHTTPYMYYFDNFNFCPNCGAKMDKGGDTE